MTSVCLLWHATSFEYTQFGSRLNLVLKFVVWLVKPKFFHVNLNMCEIGYLLQIEYCIAMRVFKFVLHLNRHTEEQTNKLL